MSSDLTGRAIASYRMTAKLGEGGVGEVWRATDSKLEREVPSKVLPEAFTEDAERLARFGPQGVLVERALCPGRSRQLIVESGPGLV